MTLRISDEDIFIIHAFGDRDNAIIFLRVDEDGEFKWTKNRTVASEFTQAEAKGLVEDADKKSKKVYAIRVV